MNSIESVAYKTGLAPGSLVHVGIPHDSDTRITVTRFNHESMEQINIDCVEQLSSIDSTNKVTWINVEGLYNVNLVEEIGVLFGIHALILEDILNTHQRPKFEEHENYLFIVLKAINSREVSFPIQYEQISIIILDQYILTFREKQDDIFESLQKRLDNHKGRIRSSNSDYLGYSIVDLIVDSYFNILDSFNERIESLDEELLSDPDHETLISIQSAKRELIKLRRAASPMRDLTSSLYRSDSTLLHNQLRPYINDVYDHALRVTELIESNREIVMSLQEIYLSSVSNRLNEIMKVLTLFAVVFIPLTFVVGIYGMNFEYMPELKLKWAYPSLWVIFILTPIILYAYFKRKNWL